MQRRPSNLTRGAALFLGPPASGKTTLAEKVAALGHIAALQVGTLLKELSRQDTCLGHRLRPFLERSELVPNELVESAVRARLEQVSERHILFDGFPRTEGQIPPFFKLLQDQALHLRIVVVLTVSLDKAIERLRARRVCPQCGAVYNTISQPPRRPGICDRCGIDLVQRQDDQPQVIRRRFEIFEQETKPVVEVFDRTYPQLTYKPSGQTPDPEAADRIAHWLEIHPPAAMT